MAMDEGSSDTKLSPQQWREAVKRTLAEIPFPPMVVIHRGWFGDKVTYHTVEELQAQDRAERQKSKR